MSTPVIIDFPGIGSSQLGFISVAEQGINVPFEIKRVYWTYFTPNEVKRGGHAHIKLEQIVFAVSGIIKLNTEDVFGNKLEFILDRPYMGLYIPKLTWRDIEFSHSAVLLCLASCIYQEDDYIRDYEEFKTYLLK